MLEELKQEDLNDSLDDQSDEADEESHSDGEEDEGICFNDELNIDAVTELYVKEIQHLLYLKDYKQKFIPNIIGKLVTLNPQKVIVVLMNQIDIALQKPDLKCNNIIGTIMSIPTLLSQKCTDGLNYLLLLMRVFSEQISATDTKKSQDIWKMFDRILQFIPAYSLEDLSRSHNNLDYLMTQELQTLTDDISTVVVEAFKRYLNVFEFLSPLS